MDEALKGKIATVIGGSGFVGRYIVQALASEGWRVRVACRRPNEALFVRTYGVVGQVEPVQCNIRDDQSVAAAVAKAEAVVNCVGILAPSGKNTFDATQAEGAARAARLAKEAGADRFVQISAIGANADSEVPYQRTKAEGEAAVRETFPGATILRPSIVFGAEDQFFNRFAGMARFSPALPLIGGDTRFQPVWVEDVAQAADLAARGQAEGGVYELGGPNIYTFRELMELMLRVIGRKRFLVPIPMGIARVQGKVMQNLPGAPLTEDQVRMLEEDNVVGDGVKTFEDLGIQPSAPEAVLESYLYVYRPYGQYASLTEDRRNSVG